MKKIAIITDDLFYNHNPGIYHPERPERMDAVKNALKSAAKFSDIFPPIEAPVKLLKKIHHPYMVDWILSHAGQDNVILDGGDTVLSSDSVSTALMAAGGAALAVEKVCSPGKYNKAFLAARPPGHHAEHDKAMGFCIFNNIAIAAQFAIENKYAEKIWIIDWDVHHGNGTQDIFYRRNDVFYLSMHQVPLFPGTGYENEIGLDKGRDYTLNFPLRAGQKDKVYLDLLKTGLKKAAEKFHPDLILISAGFDAHYLDPIGGMHITEKAFHHMTDIVIESAEKFCNGKIVSILEGGYHLEGLSACVNEHVKALSGEKN